MDSILTELLRPWRLESRKGEGDWYHDLPSGTECWRPVKSLGSGTFGDVSQEQCVSALSQGAVRAVKRISKRQAHFLQSSKRELEALITFSDTNHPQYQQHFVRFLGWFEDSVDLYIAMEFIQYGNLQQYIDQGVFPEPEAASVTTQVARALQFMHQKHFVHRDLKPMNILVSQVGPQWAVKVADFGIAKQTDGTAAATHGIGTPGYMAPELFGSSEYTAAVDVWALGAVAFCMRTRFPPFRTHMQLYDYHRDQTHFPVRALGSSSGFCMNFVLGTMTERPERRLTIEQVLAHDWLAIHTEAAQSMDVHPGTAAASTWGIEAKNAWSDTYGGTSTARQSLPTVVLDSSPQNTGPWRTQSTPADSVMDTKTRSPSPFAAPTSTKARTWGAVPPYMQQTTILPPPLIDPGRPEMPRAETTSSTASWRTGGSGNTNMSTVTSISSAPVSPPVTQATVRPSSNTPANSGSYLGCKTCGKTFKKREYLMAHAKANYHTPEIESEMPGVDAAESEPEPEHEPELELESESESESVVSSIGSPSTSDPYLDCKTCGKSFQKREYLMAHAKANYHEPRIDTSAKAMQRLAARPAQTTGDPYLNCKTCGKTFAKREYLLAHAKANYHTPQVDTSSQPADTGGSSGDSGLTCGTCGKSFKKREYLVNHAKLLNHIPQVAPKPRGMEKRAGSSAAAARDQRYLACKTCGQTFKERSFLMGHVEVWGHTPQVQIDPRLTCLACGRAFAARSQLFEHLEESGHARSLDTGRAEAYTRPDDSRRADEPPAYVSDRRDRRPKPQAYAVDPRDTCLVCHRTFDNRNALFQHLRSSGHEK
ncbi:kinase-like domain-containing protein [Xylaria grammica]|nr:kinase-like domain-containing protein [Xylaria grammica]